tara:strand:+ start:306 stop:653 length:348 start_codon:yes stop_codon:yes gene_type:complete
MNIIKNPIFLGIFGGIVTYLYYYYNNEKNQYYIPCALGCIIWFLSSLYFKTPDKKIDNKINTINKSKMKFLSEDSITTNNTPQINIVKSNLNSNSISNNKIKIPNYDVFMDLMSI